MKIYSDMAFDEERALYGVKDVKIKNCSFEGPADGESALKETSDIEVEDCRFLLRYPLWHTTGGDIKRCVMTETCRAALWYDEDIRISDSTLGGIKALRECKDVTLDNCKIDSTEFGWFCGDIKMNDCELNSEYPFLKSKNMEFENLSMTAKYSFQYVEDVTIRNSNLNTKDAFWHSKNVTVYDSVVRGEYLGWYSEGLRLVRCKIIGTQPLCYAKGLVLEDCEMIDCDLAFEKSDVRAEIVGNILSVKNPKSGKIAADSIGEIIRDDADADGGCEIDILSALPCCS